MFFFQLPVLPEVLLTAFGSALFRYFIHDGREDVIGTENVQVYMDQYRRPSIHTPIFISCDDAIYPLKPKMDAAGHERLLQMMDYSASTATHLYINMKISCCFFLLLFLPASCIKLKSLTYASIHHCSKPTVLSCTLQSKSDYYFIFLSWCRLNALISTWI